MNTQLRRLTAMRQKLKPDTIRVYRQCEHCGVLVDGNPRDSACGSHPIATKPEPGERTLVIERSYGTPSQRLH